MPTKARAHLVAFHAGRGGEEEWGCGECSFLASFDELAEHCFKRRHDSGRMTLRRRVPIDYLPSLLREIQDKLGLLFDMERMSETNTSKPQEGGFTKSAPWEETLKPESETADKLGRLFDIEIVSETNKSTPQNDGFTSTEAPWDEEETAKPESDTDPPLLSSGDSEDVEPEPDPDDITSLELSGPDSRDSSRGGFEPSSPL